MDDVDAATPDAIPPTPPALFRRPHAQVLLIQHLECSCGTTYSFPLEHLLYRYELTTSLRHLSLEGRAYYGIQLQVEHLTPIAITSCQECYRTYMPLAQIELFPDLICPPPPPPRRARIERSEELLTATPTPAKGKRKVKATKPTLTIADF